MPLTHTDTNVDNLKINKFQSKEEFQSAWDNGLIGTNEISFINDISQADWNQTNTSADDYIKNKPVVASINIITWTNSES